MFRYLIPDVLETACRDAASGINGLEGVFPHCRNYGLAVNTIVGSLPLRLNSKGDIPLDLARRINMLAIWAAFAFVGAVLLGMI